MPEVSIVIPVYNVEPYLRLCLDSVSAQTFRDFEALLVDDGSTDVSGAICDEYAAADARFKVFHQKNLGLSGARNTGIKNAAGKCLYFVDSDDWLERNAVETLYGAMEAGDAAYAVCGYFREGRDEGSFMPREIAEADSRMDSMLRYARKQFSYAVWNKMYLRETVAENGILFYEGEKYVEDHAFNLRYLMFCGKIAVVSSPLYHYRSRPGQISAESPEKRFSTYVEDTKKLIGDFSVVGKLVEYRGVLAVHFAVRFNELLGACMKNAPAGKKSSKEVFAQAKKLLLETGFSEMRSRAHLSPKEKLFFHLLEYGNAGILRCCYRLNALLRKASARISVISCFRAYARKIVLHRSFILRRMYLGYTAKRSENEPFLPVSFENAAAPRLFLIGTPEYGNMGDHAIAAAEKRFLEKEFPYLPLAELTENETVRHFRRLKKQIKPKDIILLQGGGNMGDSYPDQEMIRKKILRAFPENAAAVFPQTVSFSGCAGRNRVSEKMRRYYNARKNLFLCAREKRSFKIMSDNFVNCKTALIPDAAFLLSRPDESVHRKGALLCLRADMESILTREDRAKICFTCLKKLGGVSQADTCLDHSVYKRSRETELESIIRLFMSAELVVTDRLHGMILSAVTETPCVVFDNSNHKISGSFEWIKDQGFISFCGDTESLEESIGAALAAPADYGAAVLSGRFAPLLGFIRENSNGRN